MDITQPHTNYFEIERAGPVPGKFKSASVWLWNVPRGSSVQCDTGYSDSPLIVTHLACPEGVTVNCHICVDGHPRFLEHFDREVACVRAECCVSSP